MNLKAKSFELRKDILQMVYRAKAGHIGGDFSVCDILNVLYNQHMNVSPENFREPTRDRFVLSKGHTAEALYCVLADRGFFPKAELETFSCYGSKLIGHPNNKVNGIEINAGSLGHGLSVGVGMALASRMDNAAYRVYVVMGDGELAEGSVWEGAMSAGHYRLANLTAVIDRNQLQISGNTEDVMAQEDLRARWSAFGWHVLACGGNDIDELDAAIGEAKGVMDRPTVIIAHTTKGCGVSFMENQPEWHHRIPTEEEYMLSMQELEQKRQEAVAHE